MRSSHGDDRRPSSASSSYTVAVYAPKDFRRRQSAERRTRVTHHRRNGTWTGCTAINFFLEFMGLWRLNSARLLSLSYIRFSYLPSVLPVTAPPFVFCFSVIFAYVRYTRNVIINVTSIGRQISELMFLWWPAILYSVLNSVCLLMVNKWMMMMMMWRG